MMRKILVTLVAIALLSSNVWADSGKHASKSGRWDIHGDTVYDRNTNLTWKRCPEGMKLVHDFCIAKKNSPDEYDSDYVYFSHKRAVYTTSNTWRLPTREELLSIYDYSEYQFYHDEDTSVPGDKRHWGSMHFDVTVFPAYHYNGGGEDFWTSEIAPPDGDDTYHYYIDFSTGTASAYPDIENPNLTAYARLVHTGK